MLDEILRLHAEPIGHARDVVEVGDGLHGVVHGAVVEPVGAQPVHILAPHPVLLVRQIGRELAQRARPVASAICTCLIQGMIPSGAKMERPARAARRTGPGTPAPSTCPADSPYWSPGRQRRLWSPWRR